MPRRRAPRPPPPPLTPLSQRVALSHPDRLVWPEEGIRKIDLARYYAEVAPFLLQHGAGRPVTCVVCPRGLAAPCYYRRDRPADAPSWLGGPLYRLRTQESTATLLVLDEPDDLLWLVNRGAIEFHFWLARLPDLEHPDQLIFDLDPGATVEFPVVRQAARVLRQALAQLGLRSYPKTTGGSGLHVTVPLQPHHPFPVVRAWAQTFARRLAAEHPTLLSIATGPTHAGDRVTIDYAQIAIGKNMVAPYSVRARPGAPVATPLRWEEIDAGPLTPRQFTLETVRQRLQRYGDLAAGALTADQRLPDLELEPAEDAVRPVQ
ncbi:MAG: non-homologous end-joining DNA ligase [Chloroflexi bacterium]|jgi:bifunctional non-homologous end joining protein LigD|nr:non-homologous end-joining DNA ligase [Chloroflexota bacterium]